MCLLALVSASTASNQFDLMKFTTTTNLMLKVRGDGSVFWKAIGQGTAGVDWAFVRALMQTYFQWKVSDGTIIKYTHTHHIIGVVWQSSLKPSVCCSAVVCRRLIFTGYGAAGAAAGSPAAIIRAEVQDPSPSLTVMGGKLVFATSAEGTITPIDRLTINNQVLYADLKSLEIDSVLTYMFVSLFRAM